MATFITKFIAKKLFKEKVSNHFGQEDPYFETVPATRLDGRPTNKTKKVKKALPPGISEHDAGILTKVKRRAYRLDMSLFELCGIRFGWGSAIALIPAVGDALDALMALMVFRTCHKVEDGLPTGLRLKMMWNIIFDFFIGLIPFVGDLADAAFRCNTKNAILLEELLRERGVQSLKAAGKPVPNVDPSDGDYYDQQKRQRREAREAREGRRGAESDSDSVIDREPVRDERMTADRRNGRQRSPGGPDYSREASIEAPARANTRSSRRSSGWFGRNRGRAEGDVEEGIVDVDGERAAPSRHRSTRN